MIEVALDYLAVGIDPAATTICVQSGLSVLAQLTLLYMNFVTVARLERNPAIKDEIHARGFGRDIPTGFLLLPRRPGRRHHRLQGDGRAGGRGPDTDH